MGLYPNDLSVRRYMFTYSIGTMSKKIHFCSTLVD